MRATGVESSDLLAEEASLAQTPRAAASRFHLTLAGVECGFLKSCEGGTMTAEVVTEPPGPEHYLKKHLGAVAPEPLVLSLGLSMTNDVYDWINASWNGKPERRSGMITFVDADGQAKRALAFTDALITEVAFPKLDGSSKDPCILAVTLEPESTQRQKASGKPPTAAATKARQLAGLQLPRRDRWPRL